MNKENGNNYIDVVWLKRWVKFHNIETHKTKRSESSKTTKTCVGFVSSPFIFKFIGQNIFVVILASFSPKIMYKTINFYQHILLVFGFESKRCKIKFHWFYITPKNLHIIQAKYATIIALFQKLNRFSRALNLKWKYNWKNKKLSHIKITHQNFNDKV